MSSARRWNWLAASMVVVGMLVVGVVFCGCSPAPAPKPEKPATTPEEPATTPEEPATTPEEPATTPEKPATTPEEPATTPEEPATTPEEPATTPEVADPSAEPKVSSFAPAEDVVDQVAEYIQDLEDAVENEAEYNDSVEKIAKDSNTLILIALALGMHDEENKYKASAGAIMKAAQELAATKDFASARNAVVAVKLAAAGQASPATELKWEKVASLAEVMKKVPLINTKLKSSIRRLERRAKTGQGHSAVLAVIAQGSMANAGETEQPNEVEKWRDYCAEMREAAAAVNAAIRARDKAAIQTAMQDLAQNCDDCHEIFHPDIDKTRMEAEE